MADDDNLEEDDVVVDDALDTGTPDVNVQAQVEVYDYMPERKQIERSFEMMGFNVDVEGIVLYDQMRKGSNAVNRFKVFCKFEDETQIDIIRQFTSNDRLQEIVKGQSNLKKLIESPNIITFGTGRDATKVELEGIDFDFSDVQGRNLTIEGFITEVQDLVDKRNAAIRSKMSSIAQSDPTYAARMQALEGELFEINEEDLRRALPFDMDFQFTDPLKQEIVQNIKDGYLRIDVMHKRYTAVDNVLENQLEDARSEYRNYEFVSRKLHLNTLCSIRPEFISDPEESDGKKIDGYSCTLFEPGLRDFNEINLFSRSNNLFRQLMSNFRIIHKNNRVHTDVHSENFAAQPENIFGFTTNDGEEKLVLLDLARLRKYGYQQKKHDEGSFWLHPSFIPNDLKQLHSMLSNILVLAKNEDNLSFEEAEAILNDYANSMAPIFEGDHPSNKEDGDVSPQAIIDFEEQITAIRTLLRENLKTQQA